MSKTNTFEKSIIRTNRGLSIAGTRITIYNIMDYLEAHWPPKLIRDRLNLSDKQINDAMEYIQAHKKEVEAEYQLVLKQDDKIRQYWEERNRKRFDQIEVAGPPPGKEEIWKKLQAKKQELGLT